MDASLKNWFAYKIMDPLSPFIEDLFFDESTIWKVESTDCSVLIWSTLQLRRTNLEKASISSLSSFRNHFPLFQQMQNTTGQITHQEAIWKISNSTMALLPPSSEKIQIKYPLDLPAQSVEPSNWRIRESFKKPMGARKNCSTFVHLNLSNEANFKKLFKK